MSASLTIQDKVTNLRAALEKRMETIARTLPAQFMSAPRFAQIVTTLCAQNPALLDCKPVSLIGAVLQAASLGLSPEPATGQAYFLPFKGVVTFVPGYKGLATLAWRSGQLASLAMNVARVGDDFEYELGSSPFLRHRPKAQLDAPVLYAYATAKPIGGDMMFEVLTLDQVNAVKARSPSARSGRSPWTTDFEAMAKKTALRRLAKLLPMSSEKLAPFVKAVDFDERAELGLKQHFDTEITDAMGETNESTQEEQEEVSTTDSSETERGSVSKA